MNYKFLDIGCKTGGSFSIAKKFGYSQNEGIGIDINHEHIKNARERGYNAEYGDITQPLMYKSGSFELVIASHVLEHLKSKEDFIFALHQLINLSSKYVYISFPVFDHDEYLKLLGFKAFYSDWNGHACMVHLEELKEIVKEYEYELEMVKKIENSMSPEIHPLESPRNQHEYDSSIHPPKKDVKFEKEMYREFRMIIKK
jgi:SAM-dependent methyltransferase